MKVKLATRVKAQSLELDESKVEILSKSAIDCCNSLISAKRDLHSCTAHSQLRAIGRISKSSGLLLIFTDLLAPHKKARIPPAKMGILFPPSFCANNDITKICILLYHYYIIPSSNDASLYYLSTDCNCLHTGARSMYTCLLNHKLLQKR